MARRKVRSVMEPRKVKKAGRELGNAAAAAAICVDLATGQAIHFETYQWYVRVGKPAGNRAPGHVEIDNVTGQRMYPLKDVREWQRKRRGRGNWGGIGAKARRYATGSGPCPECGLTVNVWLDGRFVTHDTPAGEQCGKSGKVAPTWTEGAVIESQLGAVDVGHRRGDHRTP